MLLFLALACAPDPEPLDPACERSCTTLVDGCALEAYPDLTSCHEGCRYAVQEGAAVADFAICVEGAGCDPFVLVDCEHAYGLD